MTIATTALSAERADLLDALSTHRDLFRVTLQGISDEQAGQRTTVSELCLGGILKHVTRMESRWHGFIAEGPSAIALDESSYAEHAASFQMLPDDTVAALLERFDEVSARTTELLRTLPDLDASQPLPEAPWFEPGARWTARRVFTHILAELTQHAGHADIVREAIDGQKTMG